MVVDKYSIYIKHLQNMAEDSSFKPSDRQKFKGWLRKWQNARIPLLCCLFVEILSPAKFLSLAFQDEKIDIVSSVSRVENAYSQLKRIEKKEMEELPTVKRFLQKVEKVGDNFFLEDVILNGFQEAKKTVSASKELLLNAIKDAMETRLDISENKYVKSAAVILNTEGWEKKSDVETDTPYDNTFADKDIAQLYDHFIVPLSNAGIGTLSDLLEQWHNLVSYTVRYLDPSRTHYFRVWRRIFDSQKRQDWQMVLVLVELLFAIPISNAKVERLFSQMKRVKTDSRSSLTEDRLNSLLRIGLEGPDIKDFNPTAAVKLWMETANRRIHQTKRKKYKARESTKKRPKVLIDDPASQSSSQTDDNDSSDSEVL